MSAFSICKCGKKMLWAKSVTGKSVPLDPVAPVFKVWLDDNANIHAELAPREVNQGDAYMVSHFATCKFANDFSHGRRDETPPAPAEGTDGQQKAAGDAQS